MTLNHKKSYFWLLSTWKCCWLCHCHRSHWAFSLLLCFCFWIVHCADFWKKRERRRKPSEITTGVQVWRRCSVRQCCCCCSLQLFSFSPLDDYTLWSGRDRGGSSSSNRTMAICHSTTLHFLNGKSTWATASFETYAAAAAAVSGIFFFFYFFDWSTFSSSPSAAAAAAAHSATLRRQSIIIDSMTPIRVDAPLEKEEEEMLDRQDPSFHNSDKVCAAAWESWLLVLNWSLYSTSTVHQLVCTTGTAQLHFSIFFPFSLFKSNLILAMHCLGATFFSCLMRQSRRGQGAHLR